MSVKSIYDALRAVGMTAEGACGLMGNFQAESAMRPNNVEDRSGMDDNHYVQLVDGGSYDFATDYGKHYGFGLAQWTLQSRKENLQSMARKRGCSIADEKLQIDFCVWELTNQFPTVWQVLTGSHDLYEATRIVCVQYERPAVPNVDARYRFARDFFAQLAGGSDPDPEPDPDPQPAPEPSGQGELVVMILQLLMRRDGYWDGPIDGRRTPEWRAAFLEWANDVASC